MKVETRRELERIADRLGDIAYYENEDETLDGYEMESIYLAEEALKNALKHDKAAPNA